jgi:co-chaperonin GroES (HSP10)
MVNNSGLKPLGRAVLIEPYEPELKKSVLVLPPSAAERNTMIEMRATVVEIGPEAWSDEKSPRAFPGDKVLIAKFSGHMLNGTKDGKLYRMVNDRDIFCRIEEEST